MNVLGDVGAGHSLGRYELLVPLAKGGMAVVWAARLFGTRGFRKIVAVKAMLPGLSDDPQFEEMFLAEAELASQIRHPNVCEIMDLGEQDGVLFIVMEWIDGDPLSLIMKNAHAKGEVPIAIATRIGLQASLGLHAAHELKNEQGEYVGLVHRDVSPQNILVTPDGTVKIVDFGVAKAGGRGGITHSGQMKGKAMYMAPEQADGGKVDRRSDIFALGVVLYQLITGKHPFRDETDLLTLKRICAPTPVPALNSITPRVTPALNAAIMRALEKDPQRRWPTMLDFSKALESSLAKMVSQGNDLGTFVKTLMAERAVKRHAVINEAKRIADERTDRPPMRVKPSGLMRAVAALDQTAAGTAADGTLPDLGKSEPSAPSAPSGVSVSEKPAEASASEPIKAVGPSAYAPSARPSQAPKRSIGKWIAVAALVVVAAGVAGLVFTQQIPLPASVAPAAPARPDATATAPPAPSVPPSATAEAAPSSSASAEPQGEAAPAESATPSAEASATASSGPVPASAAPFPAWSARPRGGPWPPRPPVAPTATPTGPTPTPAEPPKGSRSDPGF